MHHLCINFLSLFRNVLHKNTSILLLRQMQHSFSMVQVQLTNSLFSNKTILVLGERTQYSAKGSSPKHSLMHVCTDSIYTINTVH
jgi:hypothetical protein